MSNHSKELIEEMLSQGLIGEEEAKAELASIGEKLSEEEEIKVVTPIKADEASSETAKIVEKATESAKAEKPKKAEKKAKEEKPSSEKRGGHETLGAYAARIYLPEIEIAVGKKVSVKELIDGIKAVKIKDKAFDLVRYLKMGGNLSKYTKIGLRELETGGCVKASALAYSMEHGTHGVHYSEGTARAQSQQINSLFKTFGIIDSSNMEIKDSPVLSAILSKRGADIASDIVEGAKELETA